MQKDGFRFTHGSTMKFYHLTLCENVESIKKIGLKPNFSNGLTPAKKHKKVFVADSKSIQTLVNDYCFNNLSFRDDLREGKKVILELNIEENFPVHTGSYNFEIDFIRPDQINKIIDKTFLDKLLGDD